MEIEIQVAIKQASKVLAEIYPKMKNLDRIIFMMAISTLVDQWCADHDMTSNETLGLMDEMYETQKGVHISCGMPPKSSER